MLEIINNILVAQPWLTLGIGCIFLLVGGRWLVDGAVTLARRTGLPILFIGLTVVAAGTSSPELAFNVTAALSGSTDLSFGNVVGSNIANIALVLGVAALFAPLAIHNRVVTREAPLLLLISGAMFLLAVAPVGLTPGESMLGIGRLDGLIMAGGFFLFLILWYRYARSDRENPLAQEVVDHTLVGFWGRTGGATTLLLIGLVLLVAGGKVTEIGAVELAEQAGLSESLVGLTIVALATSLPELVISVTAARKGQADLAVGNVVGSNLFNILLVLGVTAAITPVGLPVPFGVQDLIMMVVLTLILWVRIKAGRRTISRRMGVMLLLIYVGYMAYSVLRETVV